MKVGWLETGRFSHYRYHVNIYSNQTYQLSVHIMIFGRADKNCPLHQPNKAPVGV